MQNTKKIIVTGCNKGIGYGIIEQLCQEPIQVIMACRNLDLANQSRQNLINQFQLPQDRLIVMQLDLEEKSSVESFVQDVKNQFGEIDAIVNNAGFAFKGSIFDSDSVAKTLNINYYNTSYLCELILPYIKNNGKIINNTSSVGRLKIIKTKELVQKLDDSNLTKVQLEDYLNDFIAGVADGTHEQRGWPTQGYGVSKLMLNLYTRILAKYEEVKMKNIQVYSFCPGWVKTDMAGSNGKLTIQEGALTCLYLLSLPYEFFYLKEVQSLHSTYSL